MAKLKTTWVDVQQGTEEWHAARLGIPTASRFSDVMAGGKGLVRTKYLYDLAGEIITNTPADDYSNRHLERGKIMEADARDAYELITGNTAKAVGFAKNGKAGASPDSQVGPRRGLEIKTTLPRLLLTQIVKREFPTEHYAQCQGVMWVCDWDELDFVTFWPKMKMVRWTVERDDKYLANVEEEIDRFNRDLRKLVATYKKYGPS